MSLFSILLPVGPKGPGNLQLVRRWKMNCIILNSGFHGTGIAGRPSPRQCSSCGRLSVGARKAGQKSLAPTATYVRRGLEDVAPTDRCHVRRARYQKGLDSDKDIAGDWMTEMLLVSRADLQSLSIRECLASCCCAARSVNYITESQAAAQRLCCNATLNAGAELVKLFLPLQSNVALARGSAPVGHFRQISSQHSAKSALVSVGRQ